MVFLWGDLPLLFSLCVVLNVLLAPSIRGLGA